MSFWAKKNAYFDFLPETEFNPTNKRIVNFFVFFHVSNRWWVLQLLKKQRYQLLNPTANVRINDAFSFLCCKVTFGKKQFFCYKNITIQIEIRHWIVSIFWQNLTNKPENLTYYQLALLLFLLCYFFYFLYQSTFSCYLRYFTLISVY